MKMLRWFLRALQRLVGERETYRAKCPEHLKTIRDDGSARPLLVCESAKQKKAMERKLEGLRRDALSHREFKARKKERQEGVPIKNGKKAVRIK